MKDVARELGVHTTTVSLALRNSPQLPQATRERIQLAAKRMGYRQDPLLSALVAYRTTAAPPKSPPEIAMIFDFESPQELAQAPISYRQFLAGATRKAEELGYKLQPCFFDGLRRLSEGRRIGRILLNRGVKGVILCAFRPRTTRFDFDWERFSVVQIESHHLALPLHNVSTDQTMMARDAVRRLLQQGHRRIGIAVGRDEEIYLDHAFTVGFYGEISLHPELTAAPAMLLLNGESPDEIAPPLRKWISEHRIEAIVTNWRTVSAALSASHTDGTHDPAVVLLGLNPDQGPVDGMRQQDTEVGEKAMQQLAMLLRTNETGCAATPSRILVPGLWTSGARPVEPQRCL